MNKVYEAIIVGVNAEGNTVKIYKTVTPFLAKTARAAQDAVLVDFTRENAGITGEELAGIQVRVREFQPTS